jgi:hypothetical protein
MDESNAIKRHDEGGQNEKNSDFDELVGRKVDSSGIDNTKFENDTGYNVYQEANYGTDTIVSGHNVAIHSQMLTVLVTHHAVATTLLSLETAPRATFQTGRLCQDPWWHKPG